MRRNYSNNRNVIQNARKGFRNRLIFISLCLVLWSALIVFKLVKLQILDSNRIIAQDSKRLLKKKDILALRGEIRDRNGKLLAVSYKKARVILDPVEIKHPEITMEVLGKILGKSNSWIGESTARIEEKKKAGRRYLPLFSNLAYEKGHEIFRKCRGRNRDYRLAGVHVEFFPERHYPKHWLASHLIGFVSKYDPTMNEGLERAYNDQLAGKNGIREVLSDARQNNLAMEGNILKPPSPGADLMLTIDENIQFLVENELQYALNKHRPDGITCIVMEPESGEILAMANLPDFDPEHYGSTPKNHLISRRNRAVEFQYEPASAFKIVTISSALERGLISLDNKVYCENGGIKVFNRTIRDHKPFGSLTYREVLWYSSNVGAIKAALEMTPEQFHESIEMFGFGKKTGIDLPAEINGHFRPAREWERTSPCFLAMGHEIGATPLQMLVAANVIANGGFLVQPRVGKKLIYENGNVELLAENHPSKRILSSKTVSLMKEALRGVVEQGTGKKAAIAGVHVFGKTGTAQRLTQKGYSKKDYNASFVGFFPAEKPRYAMIVVVYNPHRGGVHGGEVAAPIFSRIGEGIIWYERSRNQTPQSEVLNVPSVVQNNQKEDALRIKIATEPPVTKGKMPNVIGLGIKSALKKCTQAGVFPKVKGAGWVVSQSPEPQAFPKSSGTCWIKLKGG